MAAATRYPVVLVHGLFGYGRQRPLWNLGVPYWPERELREINTNVLIADVGTVSSDHDRACELFYQLYGGTVDYGEAHVRETFHARFGPTYDQPLHPTWSAAHPVHLVGHSMGSTTAIELYQMLCADAFGVGSDHRWVRSITCIAGPLTGSTFSHMFGLHGDSLVAWTPAHLLTVTLSTYFKLYHAVPVLRGLFDLRMEQWKDFSLRETLAVDGLVNRSMDSALFACQPARRIARNSQLKHMDKLFLMSITTSPRDFHTPKRELGLAALLALLGWGSVPKFLSRITGAWLPVWARSTTARGIAIVAIATLLWRRVKRWNYAKMPSMFVFTWLMRHRAKSLHEIYTGFDPDHWQHNDGAVNIHSMLRPWFPKPQELAASKSSSNLAETAAASTSVGLRGSSSTVSLRSSSSVSSISGALARCESHISIDAFHRETDHYDVSDDDSVHGESPTPVLHEPLFKKGRWYVYRVDTNHLAGTYWDSEAGDLFKSLFTMISTEYEREPWDVDPSDTRGDHHSSYHHTEQTRSPKHQDVRHGQRLQPTASVA